MSAPRILGIVILAVGIVLLIMGMNASHSFADQVSNSFTGRLTDGTMWYIILGIVGLVGGAALLAFGGSNRLTKP